MRRFIAVPAVAVAAVLSAAAGPPPGSSPLSPATRFICIDVDGQTRPILCRAPASRLDGREDICLCPVGRRIEAPVCGPGERPQPESRAFELARRSASRDGSLVGDLYGDRPMCVAPRNR